MTPGAVDLLIAGLAAVAAGATNALAGGGTLITFPTLVALGLPPVTANVTNTVALCPGYLGGMVGQAGDLRGQRRRLLRTLPAAAAGGLLGGWLLLESGERLFRELVPFLILLACLLLAVQESLRERLLREAGSPLDASVDRDGRMAVSVGLASIYGGYFGAGLSVILLAVLGLYSRDTLNRLNAAKQAMALAANAAAAVLFVARGGVVWPVAATMAVGAVLGGALGGRLASRVRPAVLRRIVIGAGLVVAAVYLVN